MTNSIFTKLASITTIIFFLGNDLIASLGAFHRLQMMEVAKYQNAQNLKDAVALPIPAEAPNSNETRNLKNSPKKWIDPIDLPNEFSNRAPDQTAYIGAHHQDVLGSPNDDVFSIDLQEEVKKFQFAYLQYEVKGIANAEELPKSINGGEVYVGGELKASDQWQRVMVMVDYEDLKAGNNQVRFALNKSSQLAAEVKNVQIHLTATPRAANKGVKMKRQLADERDFKLLISSPEAISFKNRDLEMASIPKSIRNLTRNAWGYGQRNNANELVKVAIGVDASKLNSPNDLKEANVFYYNTEDNSWKKAHTEKVDMASAVLEASVPPNTDYFAGLIKSPDMPEASAFLPTGISDIEAANPAAGMNLISPPQQSRTGEASISFPLEIPAGRQGLSPSLALSYSSDGGAGWCGYGWNMSVPSVSIDTRWGVPSFPANNQEEVYSLNGSPLSQEGGTKGNRAKVVNGAPELSPRLTSKNTVRFFERTMNGYKKIERIGLSPRHYVWVETTSNNTKLYYGTLDGTTVDPNSTLEDASGNIVKWGLTKMEDQWGNHIKYYYHKDEMTVSADPTLNPIKDGGVFLILDRIEYTGFNQDPGQYKVVFESSANRLDATVSMKTGFKVLDDHRLDKIVVKYGSSTIKDYRLYYSEGDFRKTRLDSIAEYRKGSRFYAHDFEYYSGSLSFGDEQVFPYDNLSTDITDEISSTLSHIVNPILNVLNASPIKASSTWGWSSGGSVGLGIAPIGDYFSGKVFTFSGQYGYSESYSKDKRSLMDMNGDGLLDMVVDKKSRRGFYPLQRNNSVLSYGPFVDIHNNDRPLFKNKSTTQNGGFDFTMEDNVFYFGKNWSSTTSTVQNFTTDYNADGFPDLVIEDADGKSKVLFGSLNSLNELQYNPSSSNTPNPIFKDQPLDIVDVNDEELKDLEMVKIWTAPFAGTINITGLAENVGNTSGETRVAVQKNDNYLVHGFRAVDANNSISTNYSSQSVAKGDVILFRAKSGTDGQQDLLTWNPRVEYTNINYYDGNGIEYTDSKYEDAFIPSGAEFITIQGDQKIKVDLNRSLTGALNDDLVFNFTVEDFDASNNLVSTKVYSNILDAGTTDLSDESFQPSSGSSINFGPGTFQNLPGYNATHTYRIHFSLFSTSNVHWRYVKFRPIVEVAMIGTCDLGATMYPTVEYGTYNRIEHMSDWFSPQEVEVDEEFSYRVWPSFNHSSGSQVQDIFENASGSNKSYAYMTVKDGNQTLSKLLITFHQSNGSISFNNCDALGKAGTSVSSSSSASVYSLSSYSQNENLIVEFFVDGYTFSEKTAEFLSARIDEISLQDNANGPWQDLYSSTVDYNIFFKDPSYVGDKILHWGQFAWSFESNIPEDSTILKSKLRPDIEAFASDTENQYDPENLPGSESLEENSDLLDPMNHRFIVLKALRGEKDYMLRTYEKSSYSDLQTSNLLSSTVSSDVENLDRYACMGSHIGIFASGGMSSPGKFGESEIIIPTGGNAVPNDLYMAYAATLVSKSKSSSSTSGILVSSTSSNQVNNNIYYSKSIVQFQDYNGDGYPDRMVDDGSDVNANLTSPLGGHKSPIVFTSFELSKGVSDNSTSAKPGSFVDKDQRFEKMGSPTLNYGTNNDLIQHSDINGDGLPDRIQLAPSNGISAALNYGSGLQNSETVTNYNEGVPETSNSSISLTPNLEKLNKKFQKNGASFKMGIGVNHAANNSNTVFIDLNGDGLSDCITLDGMDADVFINLGTSFYSFGDLTLNKELNNSSGFGFSGSLAGTYAFPSFSIPVLGIDLKVSVNANGGANFSQNEVESSFQDVNGDGFVDYITEEEDGMKVRYGQIGKSNLLHIVNNPLGGSIEIDYERVGNKTGFHSAVVKTHLNESNKVLWDMPNSKWVMNHLTIKDGMNAMDNSTDLDGADEVEAYFLYDGGIKSRRERDFLGFTRTEKRQMPFSNYNNRNGSQLSGFEFGVGGVFTTGDMYYISEVNQYIDPTSNNYLYRKRSEYTNSVLRENFTYLCKKNRELIAEGVFAETFEMFPISMNIYTYQFRNVCIDPASTYFNELYPESEPESAVNWLLIDETESIFPALTSIQKIQYPEVMDPANSSRYASQKFLLSYDDRWNVIQYEDEGKLVSRNPGTTVVESYTRNWYDYITQSQNFSSLTLAPELSDEHFNGYYVSCNTDPSYSTEIVYIAKKADPCFGFTDQNYPGDDFIIVTHHKKAMSENVQILAPSFSDVYVDKLIAVMEYFEPGNANGQYGVLKTHKIYENAINPSYLKRHSEVATLWQSKVPGSIWNVLSSTEKAITDLQYNSYGNVSQVKGPENATGQRMTLNFSYDSQVNQFVTGVSNSYGESSCSIYDYETGNLLKSVDINGHAMRYVYDDMFRVKRIFAPRQLYSAQAAPTIEFEYFPRGINPSSNESIRKVPVAITYHNMDVNKASNPNSTPNSNCSSLADLSERSAISTALRTATFVDGMSKVIQVKKDVSKSNGSHQNITETMVSGWAKNDQWAKQFEMTNSVLESSSDPFGSLYLHDSPWMSNTEFDYLGRPKKEKVKVGKDDNGYSEKRTEYTYGWDVYGGIDYIATDIKISNGTTVMGHTRSLTNPRGRQRFSQQIDGSSILTTEFVYNPLGELISSVDPLGEVTSYEYDLFGRTIEELHPDRGTTSWTYDLSGNMTHLNNEGTGNDDIIFSYNYNRMTGKSMPISGDLYDVQYTYGSLGDGKNGAGRVVSVIQGTNFKTENYKYDELGNQIYEQKVINVPQTGTQTWATEFDYDSWGRLLEMQYPDGEEVYYHYTSTGDLESIENSPLPTPPLDTVARYTIKKITYDGFGNIDFMRYANDAEIIFEYDSVTRSMAEVQQWTKGTSDTNLLETYEQVFSYDGIGRINALDQTKIISTTGSANTVVSYDYDYTYDKFNRLTGTSGSIDGETFNMSLTYNAAGGIKTKNQSLGTSNSYNLSYGYHTSDKHQIDTVDGHKYTYNDAGSIVAIAPTSNPTVPSEEFVWNEEEWLMVVENSNGHHHYVYDQNGERIMKSTFTSSQTAIDGEGNTNTSVLDPYAVYVNPYYIVTRYSVNQDVSKHYYMGSQRVATERLVWGESAGGTESESETGENLGIDASGSEQTTVANSLNNYSTIGENLAKNNPVTESLAKILTNLGLEENKDFDRKSMDQAPKMEEYFDLSMYGSTETGEDPDDENDYYYTRERYWYHPNYLGNVDMITNDNGHIHQYFVYSPFGENMYQYNRNSDFDSRYRFNGKELDPETGNGYYGARYYNPKISVWLSVDALSGTEHNRPLTPYHFSANNPIIFIDPDGNDWYQNNGSGGYVWFDGSECKEGYSHIGQSAQLCGENGSQINLNEDKTMVYTSGDGSQEEINNYQKPSERNEVNIDALLLGDDKNDVLPNVNDFKNGEEVSINSGDNYILHENKWLRVENSGEWQERVDRRKNSRRPPMPRTAGEKMGENGKTANFGGLKSAGGFGSVTSVAGKAVGKFKYTPLGVFVGFTFGSFDSFFNMAKEMKKHDAHVEHLRNSKNR